MVFWITAATSTSGTMDGAAWAGALASTRIAPNVPSPAIATTLRTASARRWGLVEKIDMNDSRVLIVSWIGNGLSVGARIETPLKEAHRLLQRGGMVSQRGMRDARKTDHLGQHTCPDQVAGIFLGFDVQHVVLRGRNQRGGQTRQTRRFERRGIRMHTLRSLRQIRAIARRTFLSGDIGT